METLEIARKAFKTLIDAGLVKSVPVTHRSSTGRTWVKMENGNFAINAFQDGGIFVRAYATNGNQISIKKIVNVLEENGFSVETKLERYASKEYGRITLAN